MGLDSVALVMAVERKFDIEIPDADAGEMITVENMYDFVRRTLHQRASETQSSAPESTQLWNDLVDVIVEETGVERRRVVRTARIVADLGVN